MFICFLALTQVLNAQCTSGSVVDGLYVNEFGQGDSGSEDWVELIAVEGSGGNLDLTGWIFDDNNNDVSGVGNADGFLIFDPSNDPTCMALNSVPSGTLIVIYNDSDQYGSIPADDLDPSDCTLVLPATSICFDANGGNDYSMPADLTAPTWNLVAFRNGGDAVTTGTTSGIFHQLYYGDVSGTDVTSGGVQVDLPAVGGGDQAAFGCGSYGDNTNYSVSSTGSPVSGNNTDNTNYVANVKAGNLDCTDLDAACDEVVAMVCPTLSTITADHFTFEVEESTCESDLTTLSGGTLEIEDDTCPTGSTIEYSLDNFATAGLASIPTYNQTTEITVSARCTCDTDGSTSSVSSQVTTDPGVCTGCPDFASLTPGSLSIGLGNSTCQPDGITVSGGVITAAPECPMGSTLEYSLDGFATPGSSTVPTYDQTSAITVSTRCVCNLTATTISPVTVITTTPGTCSPPPPCTLPDIVAFATCTDDGTGDVADQNEYYIQLDINTLGSDSDGVDEVTVTVGGTPATYTTTGPYWVGPFTHSGTGTATTTVTYSNDGESCTGEIIVSETLCGYEVASGPTCDCDEDDPGSLLAQVAPGSYDPSISVMVYILVDGSGNVVTFNNTGFFTGLDDDTYSIYPYNVDMAGLATFTAAIPTTGSAYADFMHEDGTCNMDCGSAVFTLDCGCRTDDVAIRKILSPTSPGPFMIGDKVTFTITVFNQGTHPIYYVDVIDVFPSTLDFIAADNAGNDFSGNSNTFGGGTVTTTVATSAPILAGDTYDLTIVMTINSSATAGTDIVNDAEITGATEDADGMDQIDDEDDPLTDMGGGTGEDDNNVEDNSDGGGNTDALTDQDDFDMALLSLCPGLTGTVDNPTVCKGTTSATINLNVTSGTFEHIQIFYDPAAEAAGFVDYVPPIVPTPTDPTEYVIPPNLPDGVYNGVLVLLQDAFCSTSIPFTITVECPNCGTFPWDGSK